MRWPAEWEPHERTLMGWPCRTELWGETLDQARADYAAVANAIAALRPGIKQSTRKQAQHTARRFL